MAAKSEFSREMGKLLSSRIYGLADQMLEIWDDLSKAGYGEVASLARSIDLDAAPSQQERDELIEFWREYLKETLAVGPAGNVRKGIPNDSPYRSVLMDRLRANAVSLPVGKFESPEIQPVLKRVLEFSEPSEVKSRWDNFKLARSIAAAKEIEGALQETLEGLSTAEKYKRLVDRYARKLMPLRFELSHVARGVIFRKTMHDGRWDVVLMDESKKGIDFGDLSPTIGITPAGAPLVPPHFRMLRLPIYDIVPGIFPALGFGRNSYSELCLAADTVTFLCIILFPRIERLLDEKSTATWR